ncbi:hypothetical protein [Filimonas effusa]|uniref:Uncharacterized protein n=1 Tax=Filimonas effusa TaxID=2508721 RepID=A0A4Q1DE48_9BACT|nr:hypothetical protein [Filimonas effusa]RXK86869.1 hypothetical protein ESB13_08780 [Filimonas effusa]
MDLRSYKKTITELYLVANTPYFLFDNMRRSNVVQSIAAQNSTAELIKEFNERISRPINDISELAEIYAIFISISLKDLDENYDFFLQVKDKVKFEWFPVIANYYLKNYAVVKKSLIVDNNAQEPTIRNYHSQSNGNSIMLSI